MRDPQTALLGEPVVVDHTPKCCFSTGPASARATPTHQERRSLDRSTALPATRRWPWVHREGSRRSVRKNPGRSVIRVSGVAQPVAEKVECKDDNNHVDNWKH